MTDDYIGPAPTMENLEVHESRTRTTIVEQTDKFVRVKFYFMDKEKNWYKMSAKIKKKNLKPVR